MEATAPRNVKVNPYKDGGDRDLPLFALALGLAFLGLLILYPSSAVVAERELENSRFFLRRQGMWFVIGFIGMLFFAVFPLRLLKKLALPGMAVCIMMLLLKLLEKITQVSLLN